MNENHTMRLGRMLHVYIAVDGLEQKAIADEMGISESTLSRFIAGKNLPDARGMKKILDWIQSEKAP